MLHSALLAATVAPGSDQADWLNLTDATNIVRLIGIVIPLLTALATKKLATGGLKSVVTLVLSVITAVAATLISDNGHDFAWRAFVNAFVNAFVPAIAAYYGLWKSTGVAGRVANATARVGLGSPPSLVLADKGAEEAGDIRRGDLGYIGALFAIGLVLAIVGLVLIFTYSLILGIVLVVLGVILMSLGRSGGAVV